MSGSRAQNLYFRFAAPLSSVVRCFIVCQGGVGSPCYFVILDTSLAVVTECQGTVLILSHAMVWGNAWWSVQQRISCPCTIHQAYPQ